VNGEHKWPKIAERLGYGLSSKNISMMLQQHYKKILYPFDVFNQQKSSEAKVVGYLSVVVFIEFLQRFDIVDYLT